MGVDGGADGDDVGGFLVDVGEDVDDAGAVEAADGSGAAAEAEFCGGGEGDFRAVGGADEHFLEIVETGAFVFGVADHDTDIVAAALDALGFVAEEGLAELTGEDFAGDAAGFGLRFDANNLDFLFAGGVVVVDVVDAVVGFEVFLEFFGDVEHFGEVLATDLDIEWGAAGAP